LGCPLAAFAHGGALESALPSASLAVALEPAAGPEGLFDGADADALVGIARQWAAIESWAAAGLLGALRAMMRDDDTGSPAALAMGPVSAQNLAGLAA
jgi:hypothetical protein